MRLAISRAVAIETPRGWRIAKEKQAHKIDVVVALAMACHAATLGQANAPMSLEGMRQANARLSMMGPYNNRRVAGQQASGESIYGERRWGQMMRAASRRMYGF
jgi:hypothetical protein